MKVTWRNALLRQRIASVLTIDLWSTVCGEERRELNVNVWRLFHNGTSRIVALIGLRCIAKRDTAACFRAPFSEFQAGTQPGSPRMQRGCTKFVDSKKVQRKSQIEQRASKGDLSCLPGHREDYEVKTARLDETPSATFFVVPSRSRVRDSGGKINSSLVEGLIVLSVGEVFFRRK